MSREILFKAKTTGVSEWVEGYLGRCEKKFVIEDEDGSGIFVNPKTICQYTGLTDKNGNKIWENDIVKYIELGVIRSREVKVEIQYNKTHASYMRLRRDEETGLRYLLLDESIANRCEVIGNIFDNQELLEVDHGTKEHT